MFSKMSSRWKDRRFILGAAFVLLSTVFFFSRATISHEFRYSSDRVLGCDTANGRQASHAGTFLSQAASEDESDRAEKLEFWALTKLLGQNQLVKITAPSFVDHNGVNHTTGHPPIWRASLGKTLCIVDIDTRPLSQPGQILNSKLHWDKIDYTAAGMLNHYLYGERGKSITVQC
jgi:hypothetical protein